MGSATIERAVARADEALRAMAQALDPRSPFAATLHLDPVARQSAPPVADTVAFWDGRTPGSMFSEGRYRWEVAPARLPLTPWAGDWTEWMPWRPKDAPVFSREGKEFASRLILPVAIADGIELLSTADHPQCGAILEETETVARLDYSTFVRGANAFNECFALHALSSRRQALERMAPFAIAITACHLPSVRRHGHVRGSRFPFHEQPLVSASSMLAMALLTLGRDIGEAATLAEFVSEQQQDNGWGDTDQPPDPLTTWAAASLLASVDPTFDTAAVAELFVAWQREDGCFRALGPDAPWFTAVVAKFLRASQTPFAERFEFPRIAEHRTDHKTGVPYFAYFASLAELFADVPGLAGATVPLAFLDLAGFRDFNNTFGQDLGDEVLRAIAQELATIPGSVTIRDGGDEFLVVGAPSSPSLRQGIDAFRERWPKTFRERFGDDAPVVSARVLLATSHGRDLRKAREVLGRGVGELKHRESQLGRVGLMEDRGALFDGS